MSKEKAEQDENSVEKYRQQWESDEHWELRKRFIEKYKDTGMFTEDRLLCLSQLYYNIEVLGCSYPSAVTLQISELVKDLPKPKKDKQTTEPTFDKLRPTVNEYRISQPVKKQKVETPTSSRQNAASFFTAEDEKVYACNQSETQLNDVNLTAIHQNQKEKKLQKKKKRKMLNENTSQKQEENTSQKREENTLQKQKEKKQKKTVENISQEQEVNKQEKQKEIKRKKIKETITLEQEISKHQNQKENKQKTTKENASQKQVNKRRKIDKNGSQKQQTKNQEPKITSSNSLPLKWKKLKTVYEKLQKKSPSDLSNSIIRRRLMTKIIKKCGLNATWNFQNINEGVVCELILNEKHKLKGKLKSNSKTARANTVRKFLNKLSKI